MRPDERRTRFDRCGVTGKVRWRSEGAALAVLVDVWAAAAENGRRREQRPYRCDYCGGYHLTSQPDHRPPLGGVS